MRRERKQVYTTTWSPRSIFLVVFVCCIALAQAQDSSTDNTAIDPRFDAGSANLARTMAHIETTLPHTKFPDSSQKIQDTGSWLVSYLEGVAEAVGAGFVIAILAVITGIIYGIFKLVRLCCCSSSDSDDEKETPSAFDPWHLIIPTGAYAFFWVFLFTGMIIGLLNNPRFSDGITDLTNNVVAVGDDALTLGNGLLSYIYAIIDDLPTDVDEMTEQVAGVPGVADGVITLGNNVNSTSEQVQSITDQVAAIDAGNQSTLTSLDAQLRQLENSSTQVIGQVSSLTYQIADKLMNSLNSTLTNLNSSISSINGTVGELVDTANNVMTQANSMVGNVKSWMDDAQSYDASRAKAVTAIFSFTIVFTVLIVAGYLFKIKLIFNTVAGVGFVFVFLLWFLASIHFLIGFVLNDACPVVNTVVEGLLPNSTGSKAGAVLRGCLYGHESVLESLNITAFNLSNVFDYKADFEDFTDFVDTFNFSSIDDYFASISQLYSYNLTAVADNVTAASFGWNESYIYDALDRLNSQTSPTYYGENNYTNADPNSYPPPKNQTVYDLQANITALIAFNTSIYNKTTTAQNQLLAAQDSMNILLANYTTFNATYAKLKATIKSLESENITNIIGIINGLEANISSFFELGNCSFLGDTYNGILNSLCGTMEPAINILALAQYLAGFALIPMVILAEVLSFRIGKFTRIAPCGSEGDEESGGGPGPVKHVGKENSYAVALTDSSGWSPTPARSSISAAVSDSPKSPTPETSLVHESSPEVQQGYTLPPLKNKRTSGAPAV